MDYAPETYALVVPNGVVTYHLHAVYDDDMRRVSSYPTHGRLHPDGDEPSTPLERTQIEYFIAQYGTGNRLHASL